MTGDGPRTGQLSLQFPRLDPGERPVIELGAYAKPVSALNRWRSWPDGRFALIGEAQSGRTRLLLHWAAQTGAAFVSGGDLARFEIDAISDLSIAALAVDDADADPAGQGLLAAMNLCERRGAPVLVSGASPPATWRIEPADLRSRLQAISFASIGAPSSADMMHRLREACLQRHLNVPPDLLDHLASKLPQVWVSAERLADELERLSTRAFTVRSVRPALVRLGLAGD